MNKQEKEILMNVFKELSDRKSEHPAIYQAWWVLQNLMGGRVAEARRLSLMSKNWKRYSLKFKLNEAEK